MKKEQLEAMRQVCEAQADILGETGDCDGMIGVEFEETWMIDLFHSECMRFDVDPIEYYGEDKVQEFYEKMIARGVEGGE